MFCLSKEVKNDNSSEITESAGMRVCYKLLQMLVVIISSNSAWCEVVGRVWASILTR